jgi:hypothetical protein
MRYMLIMNTSRDGYTQHMNWPKKILEANRAFMRAFAQKLGASGELVMTAGLTAPDKAKKVRAGKDGKPITDGVFPESKEFLPGWWIVDVNSAARDHRPANQRAKQTIQASASLECPSDDDGGGRTNRDAGQRPATPP